MAFLTTTGGAAAHADLLSPPPQHPHLFSPLRFGGLELPNRIKMAAMSTGLGGERGCVVDAHLAYYRERAAGGVGLVTVEFACVASEFGVSEKSQLVLDSAEAVPGHRRLVDAVHAEGALAALQLQLPGQFAVRAPGVELVAPSDVHSRRTGALSARALTDAEVRLLVARFAEAAQRAREAGYDALELHGAHGYLLHAFLSPAMNRRDDEWGGDFDRRLAFPRAVIAAVKAASGGMPLSYRLSADDFVPDSLPIEVMERVAPQLAAAGADALDISTGSLAGSLERTIDPMSDEGWRFALARRIRTAAGIPVAVVGSRHPDRAEAAVREGHTDLIALGRPLLADPAWAAKALAGDDAAIRPCTSCNWCADQVFRHEPTGCAENPRTGRESVELLAPGVGRGRRVVVVGGGPGGLAAAVQAHSVGFAVTLLEARPELGGGIHASAAPPNKDNLLWYRDYLVHRVADSGIEVHCGAAATCERILALDPFAVIHAHGASAAPHGLPGEQLPHVHQAYDVLLDEGPPPDDWRGPVLVYGGGETGCETAELMAERGLQVLLVSRSTERELARAAEALYRKTLLGRLRANPRITLLTSTHLREIGEHDVVLQTAEGTERRAVAMVLLAQGRRRNVGLHTALEERGVRSVVIGDAREIGRIGDAVHQANRAVRDLVGSGAEPPPA